MGDRIGLAIETSGRAGSVAVLLGRIVLADAAVPHDFKHASGLLPLVDSLLRSRGLGPKDLGHVYVSVGPGSFTGLRIGVTLAKTLTLALPVRLVAVPSLLVLAHNAPAEATEVVPVLDAKRDQIFTARYRREADLWTTVEPAHLDDLPSMLHRAGRPVYLLGEGLPYHEKRLPCVMDGIVLLPSTAWQARATVVGLLGAEMADGGEFVDPDTLVPTYVRRPEAEEKFEQAVRQP